MLDKILKGHAIALITVLAIAFIVAIISFYGWGVSYLISTMNQVNNSNAAANAPSQFDLSDASKLNYHGLLPKQ